MRSALVGLLLVANSLWAADLESLLTAARAHHGTKLASLQDLVLEYTGTFQAPGGEGSGIKSTLTRKGEKWRMDGSISVGGGQTTVNGKQMPSGMQDMETVVIFDGKDTWSTVMGMKMKLPKDKAMEQMSFAEYWKEPPEGSTLLADETVSGRSCYVVQYPTSELIKEPVKYWIDKEHFVTVRSEATLSGKLLRTDFSEFKAIHGDYVIPHKAQVTSDGKKTMDVVVTRAEVNTGVSDDLFDASKLPGSAMDMDLEKLMKQAEEMQKKYEQK